MEITCDQCQSKFKIPDEKVPQGQVFAIGCPKCKHKISVDTRPQPAPPSAPDPASKKTIIDEVAAGSYDASEKPFDFVEEGAETALLCETDEGLRTRIKSALQALGYNATEPKSPIDALKQMRFHVFDLVVVNEMFYTQNPDENPILKYLDRLEMGVRRNVFVALITDRFRTMDNMAAFNKSVNITINTKNIDEIEKIIKRAVTDNDAFYRVYKEMLVKTGRI